MSNETAVVAAPAAAPTHYEILLTQAYLVPDLDLTIPGGRSIVIAAVADEIPASIIVSKKAAVA